MFSFLPQRSQFNIYNSVFNGVAACTLLCNIYSLIFIIWTWKFKFVWLLRSFNLSVYIPIFAYVVAVFIPMFIIHYQLLIISNYMFMFVCLLRLPVCFHNHHCNVCLSVFNGSVIVELLCSQLIAWCSLFDVPSSGLTWRPQPTPLRDTDTKFNISAGRAGQTCGITMCLCKALTF